MLSKVYTSAIFGIDAYLVQVEVDLSHGLPTFSIVGLPDTVVKESRDRVKTALKNSNFEFPVSKITVNLAPANIKKVGASFDLPIAIGILVASKQIPYDNIKDYIITGELSLDGSVRSIRGGICIALSAKKYEMDNIIIPIDNAREVSAVDGLNVYPIKTLLDAVSFLRGEIQIEPFKVDLSAELIQNSKYDVDFSDVKGQEHAKRALEIAAAGSHNILMIGTPGSGKTMLAKRLPTILPEMTLEEALEVTKIHSISGNFPVGEALMRIRSFRSPHHTTSDVALIGGGSTPKPGEVSLSHNGVLFLDEFPEFDRNVLEVLRQPLEDGVVTVSRAAASFTYPAEFMLVAAMNPCPCGYYTSQQVNTKCVCNASLIQKYISKISGPLLDRIDIHIEVPHVSYSELSDETQKESSEIIRNRVNKARSIQKERFKGTKTKCNARMSSRLIKKYCKLDKESSELLKLAIDKLGLSARAYDRILKVARTIADLEEKENIESSHISEAIQYRSLDRNSFL